jgi:flagellar biosynthesis GTPase FlhF
METLSPNPDVVEVESGDEALKSGLVMTRRSKRRIGSNKNSYLTIVVVVLVLVIFLMIAERGRREQKTLAKFQQLRDQTEETIRRIANENTKVLSKIEEKLSQQRASYTEAMEEMIRREEDKARKDEEAARQREAAAEKKIERERQERIQAEEKLEEEQKESGLLAGWNRLSNRQKTTVAAVGAGSALYYGKKAVDYASKAKPALKAVAKSAPLVINLVQNIFF